jgi:hypothetical protein
MGRISDARPGKSACFTYARNPSCSNEALDAFAAIIRVVRNAKTLVSGAIEGWIGCSKHSVRRERGFFSMFRISVFAKTCVAVSRTA